MTPATSEPSAIAPARVQPDCSVTAYDAWWKQADRKWIRRSPYSHKWKMWGQMPIMALRMGWMACEAWSRLKRKSPNGDISRRAGDDATAAERTQ